MIGAAMHTVALAFAQGADQFQNVSQLPPTETIAASPLVLTAYAFVWLAVAGYVWTVGRRAGRIEQELADIRQKLGARGGR